MTRESVLIVDDDVQVRALCTQALIEQGYMVFAARSGREALQRARQESPQLMIIDVLMPEMDGIDLCRAIRTADGLEHIPILLLTARGDITDKAAGFAVGADDYLTKPFDIRELTMRVAALLRRASTDWSNTEDRAVVVGELRLDPGKFTVTTPGKTVLLTPAEFQLMSFLMRHPGRVHSASKLLEKVWGDPGNDSTGALIRRHIKNIRDKIEPLPSAPRYVRTVRPHGYTVSAQS